MEDLDKLIDYLKGLAERTEAGGASVEWTFADGDTLRVEYKQAKGRAK